MARTRDFLRKLVPARWVRRDSKTGQTLSEADAAARDPDTVQRERANPEGYRGRRLRAEELSGATAVAASLARDCVDDLLEMAANRFGPSALRSGESVANVCEVEGTGLTMLVTVRVYAPKEAPDVR